MNAHPIWRLRLLAAGALLACGAVHAHTSVAVGLNFGFPGYYGAVAPGWPYGGVAIGYGPARYGYGGGYYGGWARPWGPRYVVAPAPYYGYPVPVVTAAQPAAPAPPPAVSSRPDPVIYPRNGQSAEQTEADRQACNRWATTQPSAVADASVFQRAVEACMDGRGYTLR